MTTNDRSGARGFTLIEVVVTLSMIGGIMAVIYTILFSTLDAKERAELHVKRSRIGPLLLDQIEHDVRQLYTFNLNHGIVLHGEEKRIAGREADSLRLIGLAPSTSARVERDKAVFSAVNEIGYELTENPDNRDFLILWRREDYFVDEHPLKGGEGTPLYRRITGFDVKYYDKTGKEAREEDSWDMEARDNKFPAAMLVTLSLEVEPRIAGEILRAEDIDRRQVTFKRWITLPNDLAKQVAVLPSIPLAELPEQSDATGRGGKDKGGEDDGDKVPGGTQSGGGGLGGGAGGTTTTVGSSDG